MPTGYLGEPSGQVGEFNTMSAAFSPIIIDGALVLPDVSVGMMVSIVAASHDHRSIPSRGCFGLPAVERKIRGQRNEEETDASEGQSRDRYRRRARDG